MNWITKSVISKHEFDLTSKLLTVLIYDKNSFKVQTHNKSNKDNKWKLANINNMIKFSLNEMENKMIMKFFVHLNFERKMLKIKIISEIEFSKTKIYNIKIWKT